MPEPLRWSAMSPRERDELVAEKVMGLRLAKGTPYLHDKDDKFVGSLPKYTEHMNLAWQVLHRLASPKGKSRAEVQPGFTEPHEGRGPCPRYRHGDNVSLKVLDCPELFLSRASVGDGTVETSSANALVLPTFRESSQRQ